MTDKPKTKKELLHEAEQEIISKISANRVALLKSYGELDEINGEEKNYEKSLLDIVTDFGEQGLLMSRLQWVFPESGLLTKARNVLTDQKKITSHKEGQTYLLKPVGHDS